MSYIKQKRSRSDDGLCNTIHNYNITVQFGGVHWAVFALLLDGTTTTTATAAASYRPRGALFEVYYNTLALPYCVRRVVLYASQNRRTKIQKAAYTGKMVGGGIVIGRVCYK